MRRTYRTLNDYEIQRNAEVGLFTRPSRLFHSTAISSHRSIKPNPERFTLLNRVPFGKFNRGEPLPVEVKRRSRYRGPVGQFDGEPVNAYGKSMAGRLAKALNTGYKIFL